MTFNFFHDENDNLIIEWDGIGEFDLVELIEDMENNSIEHVISAMDGWSYWYDKNSDLVYHIDDYHFNRIRELRDLGITKLLPYKNSYENYADYEWNEDREWTEEEMKS